MLLSTLGASISAQTPVPLSDEDDEAVVVPGTDGSEATSGTEATPADDGSGGDPEDSGASDGEGDGGAPGTPETPAGEPDGDGPGSDSPDGGESATSGTATADLAATPAPAGEPAQARMVAAIAPQAVSPVTVSSLAVACDGTVSFAYDNPTGATQPLQVLLIRADYDVRGGEFLSPGAWVDLPAGSDTIAVTVPYYISVYTLRAQVAWGFDGDAPSTRTAEVSGCSSVVPETASMTVQDLTCAGSFTLVLDTSSITRDHPYDVYLQAMTLDGVDVYLSETVTFHPSQREYLFAPDLSGKRYVGLWVSVVDTFEGIWDIAEASVSDCAPVDTGIAQPLEVSNLAVTCEGTLTFSYTARDTTAVSAGMWGVPSKGYSSGSFTLYAGSGTHKVEFGAFARDFTEVHAGVGWTSGDASQFVETSISGCHPVPRPQLLSSVIEADGSYCTPPRAITGWAKVQHADPARHELRVEVVEVLGATVTLRSQTVVPVPGSGSYSGLVNFTLSSGMQVLTSDEYQVRIELIEIATGTVVDSQSWVMGVQCAPTNGNSFALSLTLCGRADCVAPHDTSADGATARWTVEPIGIAGQPPITPDAMLMDGVATIEAGPILPGTYRICLQPTLTGGSGGDVRVADEAVCREVQLTASGGSVPVPFELTLTAPDPLDDLIRTLVRILQQILAGVGT